VDEAAVDLPPRFEFSDSSERHERKFVLTTCAMCLILVAGCVIASLAAPTKFGEFYPAIAVNFAFIFLAEIVWRAFLSWIAYRYTPRYKRIINYTRKLGNCFRLYKLFVFSEFLPSMRNDALTLLFIFGLDQLLFIIMFSHFVRRKENPIGWTCRFLFLQQDRPEDRPDTLIHTVTEDLMRFAVYLSIYLLVIRAHFPDHLAIIYIPLTVNNVGDGLAEPVGVFFSTWFRKKWNIDVTYSCKSLWTSKGGFWSGSFRRSFPGSACVFLTTIIVLCVEHGQFSRDQLVFLLFLMPFMMTVTEAIAPHANDGPFLAFVGCGLLVVALAVI